MNSKIVVAFALIASLCVLSANAMPVEEGIIEESQGPRQKRVTCDLLSASVKGVQLNHSACAAHCLTLRYRGGYCDKGVCNCRR